MGLAFGTALAIALIAAVFRSEFEAWMPWLAERLRRVAVRSIKGALRERLDEEWAAHLADVPGNIAKVLCAVGFNLAACQIVFARSRRATVASAMGDISRLMAKVVGLLARELKRRAAPGVGNAQVTLWLLLQGCLMALQMAVWSTEVSVQNTDRDELADAERAGLDNMAQGAADGRVLIAEMKRALAGQDTD